MEKEIRAMEALIGIEYEKITINRYWNCYRCLKACVQSFYDKEDIVFVEFCNIKFKFLCVINNQRQTIFYKVLNICICENFVTQS